MAWFNKYYRCSQGHEWQDEWDCLCDDRCPMCNESCEPYDHAEIDETAEDKALHDAIVHGTGVVLHNYPLQSQHIPFIMPIRKDYINETIPLDLPDGCVDLRDPYTVSQSSNHGSSDPESADN